MNIQLTDKYMYFSTIRPNSILESFLIKKENLSGIRWLHKGEIIYFRNFENDIYIIDSVNNMIPKYTINFNDNNIPKEKEFKDEYEIIDFLNGSNFKYASLISNIYESEIYVAFRFLFNKNKYVAIYDKDTKQCRTYNFETSDDFIIDDLYVYNDRIIGIMSNQNQTSIINIGINEIIEKIICV